MLYSKGFQGHTNKTALITDTVSCSIISCLLTLLSCRLVDRSDYFSEGRNRQWWAQLTKKLASITANPLTEKLASITLKR